MFEQHLIWRKDISVETVWGGRSRLLRMNRKSVQEGMGLTHSWSRKKVCVTGVSEQGTTRAGSQHQVGSMGVGGNCKELEFHPKCIGKPLEGFKEENERNLKIALESL